MRPLPLIFSVLAVAAFAQDHTDEATGLLFPGDVSRWVFSNRQIYEPQDNLGLSYSYKSKLSREGAITCYIYRKGLPTVPIGGDSEVIRTEIAEVTYLIEEVWGGQGAEVSNLLDGIGEVRAKDGRIIALLCAYRIKTRGRTNISISAVAGFRDHIVKIRFTFPGDDLKEAMYGLGGFSEFIAEMQAINRNHLDPLFLPGEPFHESNPARR